MNFRSIVSLLIIVFVISGCVERKTSTSNEIVQPETTPATQSSKVDATPSNFIPVKNMLSRNCAPCHDPGGKMYERLPFDNPEVVRSHSSPILVRINKSEDKKLMEDWLSEPQN